ncbi:RNA polymerase sigma factor [Sporosarcina sp. NCCP-2716]|uniref:RNA polymerase sigma factor n=1 Tax=Sporosarcina sp. NCCP-2716 TaxID=2943679 RepID=UPI00203FF1DD|nr:sigma-70 family RNA polymerase sigma factor [Sporosarcina sp. NCCP-2716]GKV68958.1 RNA polymerase sigma factor [Sporosarcina sp. NCCP-2716]
MKTFEDYRLIRKIQAGDTDAWETLVAKYYDQIFSFCVRRCLGDRALATDLTQEIFLKVVENIGDYRFSGKFFNYLFTITVNVCNNQYRKKKLAQFELDETVLPSESETAVHQLIKQESANELQAALNQLPDVQREALILKYYHELKVKDIATITGTGVATAQSRIHQGLKKLSRALNREEYQNG